VIGEGWRRVQRCSQSRHAHNCRSQKPIASSSSDFITRLDHGEIQLASRPAPLRYRQRNKSRTKRLISLMQNQPYNLRFLVTSLATDLTCCCLSMLFKFSRDISSTNVVTSALKLLTNVSYRRSEPKEKANLKISYQFILYNVDSPSYISTNESKRYLAKVQGALFHETLSNAVEMQEMYTWVQSCETPRTHLSYSCNIILYQSRNA
jgi:hypothetical protein